MSSRRLLPPLFVIVAALLGACNLSTDNNGNGIPVGIITLIDTVQSSGRAVMKPVGVFFGATSVQFPTSFGAVDSCLLEPPSDTTQPTFGNYLDAGPDITVQTDSTTVELFPDTVFNPNPLVQYTLPPDSAIPYTPGSNVTISVPGAQNQFPTASIIASTAPTYTVGPIDTLPANDTVLITWTANGSTATAMSFGLAFDTAHGPAEDPVVISCTAVDDGSFQLPQRLVSTWEKALPGSRSFTSYRWITTSNSSTALAILALSEHRVNKSTFP